MPKEYIYDEQYRQTATVVLSDGTESPEKHLVSDTMMKVTWGRGTYVQAAVVDDSDPDGMTALHISLDREGCNRLIRNLRKARDQAYGANA